DARGAEAAPGTRGRHPEPVRLCRDRGVAGDRGLLEREALLPAGGAAIPQPAGGARRLRRRRPPEPPNRRAPARAARGPRPRLPRGGQTEPAPRNCAFSFTYDIVLHRLPARLLVPVQRSRPDFPSLPSGETVPVSPRSLLHEPVLAAGCAAS